MVILKQTLPLSAPGFTKGEDMDSEDKPQANLPVSSSNYNTFNYSVKL